MATGAPVGSKALAIEAELGVGSSTIRNELALLEEQGLLSHPHTSAGRVPTDAGYRYFVDQLLREEPDDERPLSLQLMRREVDAAMRTTTETLSQVTDLVAIVTAPPVHTATIRHIEVLVLQPQVLMVVVITSTGGVSKRIFTFERPVDAGLAEWAASYLNERLVGMGLGARMLDARLHDPTLPATERDFLQVLAPAFDALAETAEQTLYVDGAARLSTSTAGRISPSSTPCSRCSSAASPCSGCCARCCPRATSSSASGARTRPRRCARSPWWRRPTGSRSARSALSR